jgi:hypothetical protein
MGTRGYLAIAASGVAVVAGIFLALTRYHESRKAAAEADRAIREANESKTQKPDPQPSTPSGRPQPSGTPSGRTPVEGPVKVSPPPEGTSFADFEGKWLVKYANGYTHEYIVTSKGEVFFERCLSPTGVAFIKPDEKRGHLERYQGDTLAYFAGGKIIERFTLKNGALTVERFDPAALYPSMPNNRGTGSKLG